MTGEILSLKVRIRGRVQGVGFRAWTVQEAQRLGLKGTVRNEPDGSVSAVISGARAAVESMVERLRTGPRGARVTDVEAEIVVLDSVPNGFVIQH
jgi:acylphosphatase